MLTPKFMLTRKFMTDSVVFVLCFSVVFLLFYRPFSNTVWFNLTTIAGTAHAAAFYLSAIITLIVSKISLYHFQRSHKVRLWVLLAWIVSESIIISVLYLLFGAMLGAGMDVIMVAKALFCTAAVLAIPYTYLGIYAAYRVQRERYDALKASTRTPRNMDSESKTIDLTDGKDEFRLSLRSTDIYYMEAQDNYVNICFDENGKIRTFMLRCPMQKVETLTAGTSLVRCHRSYIVNIDRITEFVKSHNSATVVLDALGTKAIPVSKRYYRSLPTSITGKVYSAED